MSVLILIIAAMESDGVAISLDSPSGEGCRAPVNVENTGLNGQEPPGGATSQSADIERASPGISAPNSPIGERMRAIKGFPFASEIGSFGGPKLPPIPFPVCVDSRREDIRRLPPIDSDSEDDGELEHDGDPRIEGEPTVALSLDGRTAISQHSRPPSRSPGFLHTSVNNR